MGCLIPTKTSRIAPKKWLLVTTTNKGLKGAGNIMHKCLVGIVFQKNQAKSTLFYESYITDAIFPTFLKYLNSSLLYKFFKNHIFFVNCPFDMNQPPYVLYSKTFSY